MVTFTFVTIYGKTSTNCTYYYTPALMYLTYLIQRYGANVECNSRQDTKILIYKCCSLYNKHILLQSALYCYCITCNALCMYYPVIAFPVIFALYLLVTVDIFLKSKKCHLSNHLTIKHIICKYSLSRFNICTDMSLISHFVSVI